MYLNHIKRVCVQGSGRTYVRVVDSPLFGKAAERDGTVFGSIFGSVAQMIQVRLLESRAHEE